MFGATSATQVFGGSQLGNVVCVFDGHGNSGYSADNVFTFANCAGCNLTLQDNVSAKISAVESNLTMRGCESCIYRGKQDNWDIRNTKASALKGLRNRGSITECTDLAVMGNNLNLRLERCTKFTIHGSGGRVEASDVVNGKVEGHCPDVELKDVQDVFVRKSTPAAGCIGIVMVKPGGYEKRESLRLKQVKGTADAALIENSNSNAIVSSGFTYEIFYTEKVAIEGNTFNLEGFVFTIVELVRTKKIPKLRVRLEYDRMTWDEGTELTVVAVRSDSSRLTKIAGGQSRFVGFEGTTVELLL